MSLFPINQRSSTGQQVLFNLNRHIENHGPDKLIQRKKKELSLIPNLNNLPKIIVSYCLYRSSKIRRRIKPHIRPEKKGEVSENISKQKARKNKKSKRREGATKEQMNKADLELEEAKRDDLQGKRGGKEGRILNKLRQKLVNKRIAKGKKKDEEFKKQKK